ncbi:phosphoethanolamine transferase [Helicobacter sp. 12S02634-8]|uniref:phosphoethanolamine transferase n=1 Tax=Helicobacter sp. 12S02634-8 TaxID=1476199 RepID=UPI0015573D5C|nr:phosphoethanolamine transferase [Helicobacter sp. 12S02634-8]
MAIDKRFYFFMIINIVTQIFDPTSKLFHIIAAIACGFIFITGIYYILDGLGIPKKISHIAKNVIVWITIIVGFVEFFCFLNFKIPFNPAFIDVILSTQKIETYSFLKFYFTMPPNIILLIAYAVFCILFFAIKKDWVYPISKRWGQIFLALCVLALVVFTIKDHIQDNKFHTLKRSLQAVNMLNFFYSIGAGISHTRGYLKEYENYRAYMANHLKSADYITQNHADIPNIIIVIGESASKNFMHIYGYPLSTTPHLDQAQKNGNLFVFRDVIAPESSTSAVFQTLLNFSDYENRQIPWYRQMNLIDTMKMAGYKTFWFSNQEKISVYGNVPSALSTRADGAFWTQIKAVVSAMPDGELVDLFQKHKQDLGKKNLIIFHLQGSHPDYKDRFPSDYQKFTPQDINTQGLHTSFKDSRQKVADYINSITYTDAVLDEIFHLFNDSDSIVFYLSDHAQDIFETDGSIGHRCSNYGVDIPFMIFVSDTFKKLHPQKVQAIQSALNKPFMTDDFIQSFLPLIGITTQDNISSKNIFSPHFDTHRKRIYCKERDYDALKYP